MITFGRRVFRERGGVSILVPSPLSAFLGRGLA